MARIIDSYKIVVAGGRDFTDRLLMMLALERLTAVGDEIVQGGCKTGADLLARRYAKTYGYKLNTSFDANWYPEGPDGPLDKSAGPIRNGEMAKYGDVLIAFWDGKSRGTKSMIDCALREGCEVHVYRY